MAPSSRLVCRALALASAVSLLACSDDPPAPPGYDGPWTPLEEKGDWQDPGPVVECVDPATGMAPSCDVTRPPDPSCDPATFSGLERQSALYLAEVRLRTRVQTSSGSTQWKFIPEEGGFLFDASGQLSFFMQRKRPESVRMDSQAFFITDPLSDSAYERRSFAGCRATSPRAFTGCFSICSRGQVESYGSLRAERIGWLGAESSGGLQLLSESRVELGRPADVFVTKGHAYVVSHDIFLGGPGGLTVYNVSDPAHPVRTASLPGTYSNSFWNGVWAKGDALYVATDDQGVAVFDISTPSSPVRVRSLPGGAAEVHTVHVAGDRLYAMSIDPNATFIYDVSNPLQPRQLARYVLPPPEQPVEGGRSDRYPHDAFEYQGRLYLNHLAGGFAVLDVSTPEEPRYLGRYTYPYVFSHANAVGTFQGRTVAFEGSEGLHAHLRVLDVTDPANIVKIGEYQPRGLTSIHNMLLVGTKLYVAWYHEGVRVLDVSDPSQPREVAHYNTYRPTDPGREGRLYEGAIGIRVPGDGYVYVIDTARGLLIFNQL
jgi:hypothetical protein